MPLTGAIPEGPSFFCPHCGALYAVTYAQLSNSDSNVARCVVCGQIMDNGIRRRCLSSSSFIDPTITNTTLHDLARSRPRTLLPPP